MLTGSKAGAVALGQTIVFVQHVYFDFQHAALAHAWRVGACFTVTVVQIAFSGLARCETGGFHTGNIQCRASRRGKWRAAERRVGVMFITLYI